MTVGPLAAWIAFGACLLLILYSGSRLSHYGDLIAVRTGLGGTWIGVVLLATVTSVPELVTGLSSILVVGQPDLAVGSALGSCVFNLFFIVILDFLYRTESIYRRMHQGHILSAGFSVVFLGVVAGVMVLHRQFAVIGLGPVGIYPLVATLLYFTAIRAVFRYERRERGEVREEFEEAVEARGLVPGALSLRDLYVRYALNGLVIIAAGTALPVIGESLSVLMGWDRTFVGTILLALATSVPEIVISVEAIRIGAVDLAIGDLLGSNLFDMLILAIDDLVYFRGPLLAAASPQHLFTTITAVSMTGIVVVGLSYRPRARLMRLVGWASLGLLTLALLNALILFLLG